jgi:hypothetical protein
MVYFEIQILGKATDDLGKGVMILVGYLSLRKYVGQTEDSTSEHGLWVSTQKESPHKNSV